MTQPLLTFVQFSDTHLPADPNVSLEGEPNSHSRARAVIAQINALPFTVDFALHTGDVGHNPTRPEDYAAVRETLSSLRVPLHVIPGNHDETSWLLGAFGRKPTPPYYTFEAKGVKFICLISNVPQRGDGELGAAQLAWLENELKTAAGRVVVALHHHPFSLSGEQIDSYILRDGEAFHHVLTGARDRIACVLLGHIHHTVIFARDGITYASVQSTLNQLKTWPEQIDVASDPVQMPGFNVVSIMPDGSAVIRAFRAPVDSQEQVA